MRKLILAVVMVLGACTVEPRFHSLDPAACEPIPECPPVPPMPPDPSPVGLWMGTSSLVTLDNYGLINNWSILIVDENSVGTPEIRYDGCESLIFKQLGSGYWELAGGACRGLIRFGEAWMNSDRNRIFVRIHGWKEDDQPDMDYWPAEYSLSWSLVFLDDSFRKIHKPATKPENTLRYYPSGQ